MGRGGFRIWRWNPRRLMTLGVSTRLADGMLSPMKIIFRMAVRNMLPEAFNKGAQKAGRPLSAEEHRNIQLRKVVDWSAVPRKGDQVWVLPDADHREIESITWGVNGVVEVWLQALDTDEVADEEAVAVEELLEAWWEIDID